MGMVLGQVVLADNAMKFTSVEVVVGISGTLSSRRLTYQ